MKIGIDLRSLQYKTSRGFAYYATPLIREIVKENGDDEFVGLLSGRPSAPDFGIKTKKFFWPSKINNATLSFFKYPAIDEFLGAPTVWLPNLSSWAFSKNARVILTVHDLSFLVNPSWYSPREKFWHATIDATGLIRRADKILALSEHTANELCDVLKINSEKIAVIPPGVPTITSSLRGESDSERRGNLHVISPTLQNSGDRHGLRPRDDDFSFPYILFIGVIEPRKNIETALAAFYLLAQKNKDVHFILVGARQMNHEPWTMDHPDRIHFLGQVSDEQKGVLLKNAKVLFFPSLYEGFGFPALEAMSVGVPIVASSVGALPETTGNAGILLNPMDSGAFAEALDQVINDESLRQTLINRGLERVKDFSWEKCAEETMKAIMK